MALNFSAPTTDFVQKTAADNRRIAKAFVADFTFDIVSNKHRSKVFLLRNMSKVLAFHERNHSRGIETGVFSSLSRTRGPFLGTSNGTSKATINGAELNGILNGSESQHERNDALNEQNSSTARPDIETMSQECLKVKAQNGSPGEQSTEKRRSVRHQLAKQYDDQNAHLYFDLVNIRKKLNFKQTAGDADQRPRKRVRRESISCHCHITIWDNRTTLDQKEPIVRKSKLCELTTTDLGVPGYSADIKLQAPFAFKSSELQVPLRTPQGTVLGIGDQYFLEIKIIPVKEGIDWPPIPVLGRSEGDQSTGLGRMAAEKLQGSLVARYMHLPQAPASETPLSVFFLHEGTTYRSKYGLEVNATWARGEVPETLLTRDNEGFQLNLSSLTEEGLSLNDKQSSRRQDDDSESTSMSRTRKLRKAPSPIKVTFNLDASVAKGSKEFRKSAVMGLQCPACPRQSFDTLENMQFHFMTIHPKHKFTVERQDFNPTNDELISVVFKVTTIGTVKPRNIDRDWEPPKGERDISWQAPPEPLDISAYVNGEQNWVDQNWHEGGPKKTEPIPVSVTVVPDQLSMIRSQRIGGFAPGQKGGFLPSEHVSDFRKTERKRYPPIKLQTMTRDKETMYTSISHRQVHVDEEARSESDDEMDDGWFIKKTLEELDITAENQDWTDNQRLLRKKWNLARFNEKLSHPRYLSDGLIRFFRAEKAWLTEGGLERKEAVAEFIYEFLQRRVINQEVVRDLWTVLWQEEDMMAPEHQARSTSIGANLHARASLVQPNWRSPQSQNSRHEQAEAMLRLPPYTCVLCIKPIEELQRHGLRCSEHECEAPGVWYHTKCGKCPRRNKLNWKCKLCIERIEEMKSMKSMKGKEVLIV